jgi:phage baseplate assembly protein gpV
MADLENLILRTVERWSAGRHSERHGLVTSYDPQKHLAKVTYQPEGQESGWVPIETGHIGNGYGIAVGLQPGDGKKTGDQVVVRFQEGDFESGKIVQRVHSDDQKAPVAESGEIVIWTRFQNSDGGSESAQGGQGGDGQKISLKKDGSISLTDGNGASIVMDGAGNIAVNCKKFTVSASSDIKLISATNALLKGVSAILFATSSAFVRAAGAINAKSASNLATPDWAAGGSEPPISG